MRQMEWETGFVSWLESVKKALAEQGGTEAARKVQDLLERQRTGQNQVYVVFCGLFSAGKSSLLNRLSAGGTLATGAVPTTSGVAQVDLQGSAGRVVLMDTPGVDSTDESHQAATQAALHQADVVAVVLDYQHVESDANLELARSFSEQGTRLWLIVNQIDKHVDWELSFADFRERIEQTLLDWDIHYEHLFYTSSESSPDNEMEELNHALQGLTEHSRETLLQGIQLRVMELISHHVEDQLANRQRTVDDDVLARLGLLPFSREEAQELYRERQAKGSELGMKIETERTILTQAQQGIREELVRSVELAQVAPYETTEKGRLYIESLQSGFKVGWWKAQERTKQEQERRLAEFAADLSNRVETFLLLPLHNSLHHFIQTTDWARPHWQAGIKQIACDVTPAMCRGIVHQGALVSGQYPYQYVRDVVSAVKRQVYGSLTNILDEWFHSAQAAKEEDLQGLLSEQRQLEAEMSSLSRWLELLDERQARIQFIAATVKEGVRA